MPLAPDFALMVGDTISRWRRYRSDALTYRIVNSLPRHIRKDIGWPDTALPDRDDPRWR